MRKVTLGSLCYPPTRTISEDDEIIIDYIDISSVDNIEKRITGYQTFKFGDAPSRARKEVKEKSILVSTVRPNLNAVAIMDRTTPNKTVASTGFCVLDCRENVCPRFVFNYCRSKPFIEEMVSQATGASYPAVSDKIIRAALIPDYSYSEQQAISNILDKADKVINDKKRELALLDDLIKARFVEMFGDEQYPKKALISLIKDDAGLSYGIVQPGDDGTGDMGVLRPVDLVDGHISTKSIKYIDHSIGDGFRKTELTGDELLITVRGTTGITALTDERFAGMNVTRGIAVIRYDRNRINPVFLNSYLSSDESQRYIQEHTRGATLQQINLSDLRVQMITVPPMNLQNQFAEFAIQIDKSKSVIQKSLDETQLLFDSLMQKYFG